MSLSTMPEAVFHYTLSYLNLNDLVICSNVSKGVQSNVDSNKAWASVANKTFASLKVPSTKLFLKEFSLTSPHKIITKVQDFVNKVPLGQNARWGCFFPSGREMVVEIKGSLNETSSPLIDYDSKYEYYYVDTQAIENGLLDISPPVGLTIQWSQRVIGAKGRKEQELSYVKGPFKAIIRLPHVAGNLISAKRQLNMLNNIKKIVEEKINALSDRSNQRNTIIKNAIIGVSAGAAFLSSYALTKYFNS